MKPTSSWKSLAIVVAFGLALSSTATDPAVMARSELSGNTSAVKAVSAQSALAVTEWNQQAVMLTLLPASALAPVQQARVMAIAQVAVHDAVNGITREYETYLSPDAAPEDASPEAAAIAAAHQALRSL